MAKVLDSQPPSSSIAATLAESARGALAATPASVDRGSDSTVPRHGQASPGDSPRVKREFLLTTSADKTIDELVLMIRQRTGARINASLPIRSILWLCDAAARALDEEARRIGRLRLPPRHDASARVALEERLGQMVLAALRAEIGDADERARASWRHG